MSAKTEVTQGRAVADAAKAAGVQHLIFSSLINATKASRGRLSHIAHFDGKANIDEYIRSCGIPATFVLPGMFMTGFFGIIRKTEDGGYMLALPVSEEKARIPLSILLETWFVTAAIKNYPSCVGKHIYAATAYYTPDQLRSEFQEVLGKPSGFAQIPHETFKSFLPAPIAQELLENMLLLEGPDTMLARNWPRVWNSLMGKLPHGKSLFGLIKRAGSGRFFSYYVASNPIT